MAENGPGEVLFHLERIYIKDVSYEAPAAPHVFLQQTAPQLDIQLGVQDRGIVPAEGLHEVVLSVTVAAKQGDKTVFLIEVQQAGLFRIKGLSGELLTRALHVNGAYILLPFLREAVNDLVGKGGFPQLLISPINFDALYEQRRAGAREQPAS